MKQIARVYWRPREVVAYYSRAAADLLAALSGDNYFHGGMSGFETTYRDASDQCSLSRIWGGIHPPAEDIPGLAIGDKIAIDAFALAGDYFNGTMP